MITDLPTGLKKDTALTEDKVVTIKYADGTDVPAGANVALNGNACAGLTPTSPTDVAGKATVAKKDATPTAAGKCTVKVDDTHGKYAFADFTVAQLAGTENLRVACTWPTSQK